MILDARRHADAARLQKTRVLVDGAEISGCWYVDTAAHVVKTEHILQDAEPHVLKRINEWWGSDRDLRRNTFGHEHALLRLLPVGGEMEGQDRNQPLSRTIRGKVTLEEIEDEHAKEADDTDDADAG